MGVVFDKCFAAVVGVEGGFTSNAADSGNWTGGATGKGVLKGTKYGISAASYPAKDIANLSLEQARSIYLTDYYLRVGGDSLPPPLALLAFDAAVNAGVGRAARWLQIAAGVAQDGVVGPDTLGAIQKRPLAALLGEYQAQRAHWQLSLPAAATFGLGWARRLMTVLLAAQALEGLAPATTAPPGLVPVQVGPVGPAPPQRPPTPPQDETAATEALNERSLTDALNQRPPA